MSALISLVVLIFSAIVHEVSHGLVAEKYGDSTARDEGRITLNPIPHIDPFGSLLLPFLLLSVGSPVILGSAKPVPVNFSALEPRKLGMVMVSLAGPASNFFLAFLGVLAFKLGLVNEVACGVVNSLIQINVVLGIFNLLPIPPLDGSKILASVMSERAIYRFFQYEQYGFLLILLFVYSGLLSYLYFPVLGLIYGFFQIPVVCY